MMMMMVMMMRSSSALVYHLTLGTRDQYAALLTELWTRSGPTSSRSANPCAERSQCGHLAFTTSLPTVFTRRRLLGRTFASWRTHSFVSSLTAYYRAFQSLALAPSR